MTNADEAFCLGDRVNVKATGDFGDVEIPDEDFEPENVHVRLSLMVPGDVLNDLTDMAEAEERTLPEMVLEILKAYLR